MGKIILDTSAILKWFIKERDSLKSKEFLKLLKYKKIKILLPELAKYELGNGLLFQSWNTLLLKPKNFTKQY